MHLVPGEHTHKETLIQPPGDLQADEQQHQESVKELLGGDSCAALRLCMQTSQEGENRFHIRKVGGVL